MPGMSLMRPALSTALSRLPSVSSLASWRTLALVFALVNLKGLPLAWHIRLFYRMFENWYSHDRVRHSLQPPPSSKSTHPLFEPVSIKSHSPLLEIDYNLHKSNSTYFADLDESRTSLVSKLLIPGLKQGNINLEREGHRGPLNVILGSVHTSFHREIKPYERYEVRSKILGWDKKWIIIGSWFVRPSRRGTTETLLASALSKYVVKKGKYTVPPERCFTTSGWLPARPSSAGVSSEEPSVAPTPQEGLVSTIPTTLAPATDGLVEKLESAAGEESTSGTMDGDSDWYRIEKERLRGLQIAENWLNLDKQLMEEFAKA
ncbi:hypothetical protein G647_03916 [Cladophialophora carrionii CBS 160.54]|uniref:Thioesterase domain-containing protein n=1 Tax=Cladophialophora carrionii CBS 160.54 TaxID=1279043 RepID=V9DF15_9EURO|nr:uncharacterized protein G647_03916 [Cladophialophora carrionii CBS 160.54]ETI24547.1 hypothetical protein G647_03916 [Cladophialophora carrionii CBS 160.54]